MKHHLLPLALCFVACARSPQPKLYTLVPEPGPRARHSPALLEVRRPAVAGYLDRAEIVAKVVQGRVQVESNGRWGEPIPDMIGRVLAENLATRLPDSQVFSELSGLSVVPDARVELAVQGFERRDDGALLLRAQVAVRRVEPSALLRLERVELSVQPRGRDMDAQVAAMSRLLAELADRIAQAVTGSAAPTSGTP
jgi:uncharacterized lipoprotein YmbA